jgi:hypothetical protein
MFCVLRKTNLTKDTIIIIVIIKMNDHIHITLTICDGEQTFLLLQCFTTIITKLGELSCMSIYSCQRLENSTRV